MGAILDWLSGRPAPSTVAAALPVGARARLPVIRSGTPLEVVEWAWLAEGIGREAALSIPAVAACRNLIVGAVTQLSWYRYRGGERLQPGPLLTQPDPATALPATLGGTVDDLLFYGRAYWRVLDRDAEGHVARARWTPFADVTPETRGSGGSYVELVGYRVAGVTGVVAPADMIRYDSAIPGVLDVGGRTLASAIELEQAARRLAGVELPAGVLKNEGSELGEEEARAVVAQFQASRRENGIAFLQGVAYSRETLSPADLQLIEARANVATDVARLFNVPVAMIGASPSGNASALLYANLTQQLALLVSNAVAPHLRTIEATLTVTAIPRGQSIAFDVNSYLRSDPQAAADYAIALLNAEIIDRTEARSLLGIPTSPAPADDLTPGRV